MVLQVELADFVEEAAEAALALQFGQLLPCHLHVVRHVQTHHFDARTACEMQLGFGIRGSNFKAETTGAQHLDSRLQAACDSMQGWGWQVRTAEHDVSCIWVAKYVGLCCRVDIAVHKECAPQYHYLCLQAQRC